MEWQRAAVVRRCPPRLRGRVRGSSARRLRCAGRNPPGPPARGHRPAWRSPPGERPDCRRAGRHRAGADGAVARRGGSLCAGSWSRVRAGSAWPDAVRSRGPVRRNGALPAGARQRARAARAATPAGRGFGKRARAHQIPARIPRGTARCGPHAVWRPPRPSRGSSPRSSARAGPDPPAGCGCGHRQSG